jgi:hypothetical protein
MATAMLWTHSAKHLAYADSGLLHYWIVDQEVPDLIVSRRDGGDDAEVMHVSRTDVARIAEPFEVEIAPAALVS